jgi:hypothetical protein
MPDADKAMCMPNRIQVEEARARGGRAEETTEGRKKLQEMRCRRQAAAGKKSPSILNFSQRDLSVMSGIKAAHAFPFATDQKTLFSNFPSEKPR